MNKSLCLFTFKFPYGGQESFLESELPILANEFDEVQIIPLFEEQGMRSIDSANVNLNQSVLGKRSSLIFLKLLNPLVWLEIKDWRFSHIKKMLKQAIISRAMKSYLKKNSQLVGKDLFYFYWGTNSVNGMIDSIDPQKIVARFHRFDLYEEDEPGGEPQVLRKELNARLSKHIFISEHGKNYYLDRYPEAKDKSLVSYLGTKDLGLGKMSQEQTLEIVTCSNIIPVKRVSILAQALANIEDLSIRWTHFGSGPANLVNEVYKIMAEAGENIEFDHKGRRPNSEVLRYFSNQPIDLFINVSLSEGLPVSIMEAMSFGVPVMATDCGGVSELVKDPHLLPLELSSEYLEQRIRQFYDNDFKNLALREKCRFLWENNFNADKNYQDFARLLREL